MTRFLRITLFAVTLVSSAPAVDIRVRLGPPPPPREVVIVRPGPRYVWVSGYYQWDGRRYRWVAGYWTLPPRGRSAWIPGRWERRDGMHIWIDGRWR